ncbi:transferrin binding protein [Nicoletella semolina]|uniref:Transferrin-binding protein B n=1 Tax=Nicoletella semolina TaxID=271160 RepID=A0A4R2N7W3_9PAST|nr:transferrin-binding protein-like solute binding protein [Nicoletella semolina]MDH2924656.1 hypothetical protein [Nicoletella semolina]TCP17022.1 transferrin binding protein [Nicoletella semolina]
MKFTLSKTALLVSAVVLSACGSNKGNSNFDTVSPKKSEVVPEAAKQAPKLDVNKPKLVDPKSPQAPAYVDDVRAADKDGVTPSLGVEVKIPRRSFGLGGTLDEVVAPIGDLTSVYDVTQIDNNDSKDAPHYKEVNEHNKSDPEVRPIHSHDKLDKDPRRNRSHFKYVKAGFIVKSTSLGFEGEGKNKRIEMGNNGYVYYKGVNPATHLPKGKISYEGTWDFTTDAKKSRNNKNYFGADPYIGTRSGAVSYNEGTNGKEEKGGIGHSSEFSVDFDTKKLEGTLNRNKIAKDGEQSVKEKRYDINAELVGNRFRGSATAANPNDEYFGKNASAYKKDKSLGVEGGFFGDEAQELAGQFITDDKSLFAVFGAQRKAENVQLEKAFDAHTVSTKENAKTLQTFGNPTQLVINGRIFDLAPAKAGETIAYKLDDKTDKQLKITACCDNLSYSKVGKFDYAGEGDTYFITGERTQETKIPQAGQVKYQGQWNGTMLANSVEKKASFNVDFANKSLTGDLTEGGNPYLTINAKVEQNGFKGSAQAAESAKQKISSSLDVHGGFYGQNASELGGYGVSKAGTEKVGVVFGAKRQVEQAK